MIEEFKSKVGQRGISKPTMFVAQIVGIPSAMNRAPAVSDVSRDLRFQIEAAEIPGTQMLYQDLRHYDMMQKFAYGKLHDDLTLVIRLDKDFQVKRFFDAWVDCMYNANTGDLSYKKDYTGTIHVTQLRNDASSAYTVELQDAFPVQIQPLALGWDQQGAYNKLSVVFSFRRKKVMLSSGLFAAPNFAPGSGSNTGAPSLGNIANQTPQPISMQGVDDFLNPSLRALTSNIRQLPTNSFSSLSMIDNLYGPTARG